MERELFEYNLRQRGFKFDEKTFEWRGPFNLVVDILVVTDNRLSGDRGRAEKIVEIDEILRAKRGLCRGPLYEPIEDNIIGSFPTSRFLPRRDQ